MMASDPRFGANPNQYDQETFQVEEPPQKRSAWQTCLIGCLGVSVVTVVLCVMVGIWVSRHWRGWFADIGGQAINQMIDSSDLPPPEKLEVEAQVERVTKAFGEGQISIEQAGKITQKLMDSPLLPAVAVIPVERRYFDRSKLSDEEKAEGRRTMQRFVRGIFEEKIHNKGIDSVMIHVADRRERGRWKLRNEVSDDDLRAALAEAKARADEEGIPEAPANIDPSDEVKRIIDEALNQQ